MQRVASCSEMFVYIVCVSLALLLSCQPGQCACSKKSPAEAQFATGSVLFHCKKCWRHDDVVLLSTRKTMQNLIPTNKLNTNNDEYVPALMEYFRMCFSTTQDLSKDKALVTIQLALADAIGGYLHYYVIPVTMYGFYSGNVRYEYARTLVTFYQDLKEHLNTRGELWAKPIDASRISVKMKPLRVPSARDDEDPCSLMITNDRTRGTCFTPGDNGYIPMPYLDDKKHPIEVAIPFRSDSQHRITSASEVNILRKYYVTSIQCLRTTSCPTESVARFKREFSKWLKRAVVPHLKDCQLYPAFGGSLRLLETIRRETRNGSERPTAFHTATANHGAGVSGWLSKWPLLAGIAVGVLFAWFIGAMCCVCLRRKKANAYRRLDVVASNDDNCNSQFINTFVQVFYDFKESCCSRITANDDNTGTNVDDGCYCEDCPAVVDVPRSLSSTKMKAGKCSSGDIAGMAASSSTARGSGSKPFEDCPCPRLSPNDQDAIGAAVHVYPLMTKTQSAPLPSHVGSIHHSKTYSVHNVTTQSRNPLRDSARDVSSSSCELGTSDDESGMDTRLSA